METGDTIFDKSSPGKTGYHLPETKVDISGCIPRKYLRKNAPHLPEVTENEVVRHYTARSVKNHQIDKGLYPLGSCTMKYNPKINDAVSGLPGFSGLHPYQPESTVQGALELMHHLSILLCEISGMEDATLQPVAGAHGEFTALLMIRAYHSGNGNPRKKVIFPDSAHVTKPA